MADLSGLLRFCGESSAGVDLPYLSGSQGEQLFASFRFRATHPAVFRRPGAPARRQSAATAADAAADGAVRAGETWAAAGALIARASALYLRSLSVVLAHTIVMPTDRA